MLTVVLEGGLGNRMRVAASAAAMAEHLDMPVRCLWMEQWGMRCRYDTLFLPIDHSPITISHYGGRQSGAMPSRVNDTCSCSLRDATFWESLIMARPQMRNLYIPRLLQKLVFRDVIFSERVMPMRIEGFDFLAWASAGGNRVIHAYRDFFRWNPVLLSRLFIPQPNIMNLIDDRCVNYTSHTIGVHIRRTDNMESISESPLQLFEEKIDSHIALNADTRIYLATDDEPTKSIMSERYGSRLITSNSKADRESTEGIVEGLIEMYALSRTSIIYGSAGSTYSEMAAAISGHPFEVVRRNTEAPYESGLWTTD
ncbi:MAG: hypothetical protein K6F94_05275 [Bacteroidaceae bacterium]|nr:hypothetical protein [Bacteroidaceae bacterium]